MSSELYLEKMRHSPPIDPDLATFVRDPELVAELIGRPLQLSASIETEVSVSGELPGIVLPHMDESLSEFLSMWYAHEAAHGEGQRKTLEVIGLSRMEQLDGKITRSHRIVGRLATISADSHDIIELAVLNYMAFGELETETAYRAITRLLRANGEPELARYFGLSTHQEGLHLAYQSCRARELAATMRPSHVRLVGTVLERIYQPVGVQRNNPERKAAMGAMLLTVSVDRGQELAHDVARLAHSITPAIDEDSRFLAKRYEECIAKLDR